MKRGRATFQTVCADCRNTIEDGQTIFYGRIGDGVRCHDCGAALMERGPVSRAELAEAEVQRLQSELAECNRLTGSDPDGDSDSMLAKHAVSAVRELRSEYDALSDLVLHLEDLLDGEGV